MSSSFEKYKKIFKKQGFTMVELVVTMTIVVLVTGIVMINYSSFNSSVLLTSQAYLTAFDIREAQSLAVSVRGQSSEYREEYGMYFDMATPNQYVLFQDDDGNGKHNPVRYNIGEEIGAPYLLDARFEILNICVATSLSRTCYADDNAMHDIAISFKRPDFDASFYAEGISGIESVEVVIGNTSSPFTKTVTVYSTGQITID